MERKKVSFETIEVLEGDDDPRGCLHVRHQGRVLALSRRLLEVRGAGDGPTAQPECSHPETAVLHRVPEMLQH